MFGDAIVIYRKELKNLVKDRRSLLLIVVLPLIILPAVFGTMGAMTERQQKAAASTMYGVQIRNVGDPRFEGILREMLDYADPSDETEVNLTVEFPRGYEPGTPAYVEIRYDSRSNRSSYAAGRIQAAVQAYSELLAAETLAAHGLSPADIRSLRVERIDTAPEEAQGAGILPMLLPYLILIYIFSGSMNIGLDTTAGEKERGSLASVLVNQVTRTSIAVGKVMYVVTAALMSSVSSFIGIIIAFQIGGVMDDTLSTGTDLSMLSAGTLLGLLVTLLSISILAASIVVLLGSVAKNMKEGGSYILPVYLIVIMIGIASMQMDASSADRLFFIPLVNTVFVMKETLLGQLSLFHLVTMVVINLAAAAILVRIIARLFNSEKILNTT